MTVLTWLRRRRGGERGSALVEFTWLAILLIVPMIWLVLAVFDVQRAAYGVTAAAREAGRAFVLAPNEGAAMARAEQAADFALKDQGLSIHDGGASFSATCVNGGCLESGSSVRIEIRYSVNLPFIPDVLGGPLAGIPVRSVHTTPYGEYRAGV